MNVFRKLAAAASAVVLFLGTSAPAPAADPAAAPPTATDAQTLVDVVASQTNSAPSGGAGGKEWKSPLSGHPAPAHNTWMMVSTVLVLFMTLPGLALFYGGLVRRKNVLSVLAQCLGLAGVVTIIWWAIGYSLTFGSGGPYLGGLEYALMKGVGYEPGPYSYWTSHNIWCIYQLTFAIITPALTVGAIAERMKFSAVMLFSVGWMFLVYFPVAHMLWGAGGAFNGLGNFDHASIKAIDFAGGIVVHMTSGWSALMLCILLGKRDGHGREPMPPHSMVLCMAGTGMLWVGWYGFNAGSAGAADRIATTAFVATTLSAAVGCCTWGFIEFLLRGKPSVLGLCSGAVAGLATITPASGFVTPTSAVVIGFVAGVTTWYACARLKARFGYDDALDTFGVHAIGGTFGTILAGVFASTEANPNLQTLLSSDRPLWLEQLKAGGLVLVWSLVITWVLYVLVQKTVGCRVSRDTETQGLDLSEHGEEGYIE